jgi:hypothetical protein
VDAARRRLRQWLTDSSQINQSSFEIQGYAATSRVLLIPYNAPLQKLPLGLAVIGGDCGFFGGVSWVSRLLRDVPRHTSTLGRGWVGSAVGGFLLVCLRDRYQLESLRPGFGFQARQIELFASPLEQFCASVDPGFAPCEQAIDEHSQMTGDGFDSGLV